MEQVRNGNCGLLVNFGRFFNERSNAMKKVMVMCSVILALFVWMGSAAAMVIDDFEGDSLQGWTVSGNDSDTNWIAQTSFGSPNEPPSGEKNLRWYWHDGRVGNFVHMTKTLDSTQDWSSYDSVQFYYRQNKCGSALSHGPINVRYYYTDSGTETASSQVSFDANSGGGVWTVITLTLPAEPRSQVTKLDFFSHDTSIYCSSSSLRDWHFDKIEVIPEPATIGLMLLGLVGLIRRR